MNLISNSYKFSNVGGSILINIEKISGSHLFKFTVSDNGCGMPEHIKKKISKYATYDHFNNSN